MRVSGVVGCLVLACSPGVAADEIWTKLTTDGPVHFLAYSTCSPEECFAEGVTHVIGCETDSGKSFVEIVSHDRNPELANAIASLDWTAPAVTLSIGQTVTASPVSELTLTRNDMNGAWDLRLSDYHLTELLAALGGGDSGLAVRIRVQDEEFILNPSPADGGKLVELAHRCDPRG